MVDLNGWMGGGDDPIQASQRAQDAWETIRDDAATVTLERAGVALAAQTVRLVAERRAASDPSGQGMVTGVEQTVRLFGVRQHPTVADTDVQREDTFTHDGQFYIVLQVATYPGEVQAICRLWQ